jgi:hypothetical protein
MKFGSPLALFALAGTAVASPVTLEKRASVTDACNIGYCTQNGGYVPWPSCQRKQNANDRRAELREEPAAHK